MRRLFLVVILMVLPFVVPAFAQQRWERNYGGTHEDMGYSVQQTTDGGYVVAGWTASFGNGSQVYLIKTNASGDTLWTKTYGGVGGYSVQQTQDGGYIVTGTTSSFGNGTQVYLIKTNASGDTLWTKTYGGDSTERGYSVQQTTDGGYIVAGYTNSFGNSYQVYLLKTDAGGDTLWTKTYGGSDYDYAFSVQQTSDSGYIIAGTTWSFGDSAQVYLIKTNAFGDTLWTKYFGGARDDWCRAVQQTSDGGYIIAGYTNSFGSGYLRVYLVKTDATGNFIWQRYSAGVTDGGYSVQQTSDGGYIVAGVTDGLGSYTQVYLIKTNASGDTLWTRNYGGTTGYEMGYSVQQTTDGGYIIAGYTSSFGAGQRDVYLIKTDANGNLGVEENRQGDREARGQVDRLKATPNPFGEQTHIRYQLSSPSPVGLKVYNIAGQAVKDLGKAHGRAPLQPSGTYQVAWDGRDERGQAVPAGVYLIRLEAGERKETGRVIKLR